MKAVGRERAGERESLCAIAPLCCFYACSAADLQLRKHRRLRRTDRGTPTQANTQIERQTGRQAERDWQSGRLLPLFLLTIYGIAHKLMNKLFCLVVVAVVVSARTQDSNLILITITITIKGVELCLVKRVSVQVHSPCASAVCVLIKCIVCRLRSPPPR